VKDVLAWDPTNQDVATWVANYPDNNATLAEAQASVALLQTGEYNLSYDNLLNYDALLAQINPELPAYFTNDGIITDPNYVAYSDALVANETLPGFDPVYGGYDPNLVGSDLLTLLTNNQWNFAPLENINTLYYFFDPASQNVVSDPAASTAAAAADVSSVDPTFSADLSTLLASLGTTVTSDAVSAALAEISAQITADLAAIVPQSVLSLF
jgi:hypothetical protein